MSVQTTNFASRLIISSAFEAGAVAWAATALASPIGAAGGALFGAFRFISQIPLTILGEKCLNTNDPQASSAAKTLAKAIVIFGSYAAAWGVLATLGFSLTLSHIVSLTVVSLFTSIGIEVLLGCIGLNTAAIQRN